MEIIQVATTDTFRQTFAALTPQMRRVVKRKIRLLVQQPHHPSLQSHRVQQCREDVWIGYVSMSVRLLYCYEKNMLYLYAVGPHAIVDRVHQRTFSMKKIRPMNMQEGSA